jgi:hypothetical protein
MKQHVIAASIVGVVASAALSSFAGDSLPKPQAFARYEPMMNRSPFAVATAAAPLPAATPSFAKDLYVANAARTPDGDLVTIASTTDKNFKKYLSTKTTVDGYSVPNIEWSDRVGATTVTISKDGQFAPLTFNQALLSQPTATTPQMQPQMQSQMQTQMGIQPQAQAQVQQVTPQISIAPQNFQPQNGVKQAPAVPNLPTPPPRVRGTIPRNPGQVIPQPTPAQPQNQALVTDE